MIKCLLVVRPLVAAASASGFHGAASACAQFPSRLLTDPGFGKSPGQAA